MSATLSVSPMTGGLSVTSPPVSLIVITYGKHYLVANLLNSLKTHPDRLLIREVVVVDNGFPEMGDARQELASVDCALPVRFLQYLGHNYAGSINLGAASCRGSVLVLSNSDVEWLPGFSIAPAVDLVLRRPDVGIAGPQLVFPDGRWQRSAGYFPSLQQGLASLFLLDVLENRMASARHKSEMPRRTAEEVDFVDGACMAVSRECFDQIQGFNPDFEFYAVDADFSWRAKVAGWKRVVVPTARVMHIRGASSSAIAGKAYAKRLFVAKRRLALRMGGELRAAGFDLLQRVAAFEYALLYSMVDAIWSTPASRRRATWAWSAAMAAMER